MLGNYIAGLILVAKRSHLSFLYFIYGLLSPAPILREQIKTYLLAVIKLNTQVDLEGWW